MDQIVKQWIERAEYDLETARSLLKSKRYLYVAFLCQQCIEKLLKGYIASKGGEPPFIHNLERLAEVAGLLDDLTQNRKNLLADINPFYIKARYGEYKESMSKICTADVAQNIMTGTEDFFSWLRVELK